MKVLALLLALTIVHPKPPIEPCEVYQAQERYNFIEENGLARVRLSCYLSTGNCCADGTMPKEGVCASNRSHLGEDVIVYNDDLVPCMRLEVRDIGGNTLLQQGKAIDIYRDSMDRAWQLVGEYGEYIWIQWIPREESKDEETISENSVE